MTSPITRVTMIKIQCPEHQDIAIQGFKTFTKNQKRNGVPYILSMQIGRAYGHVLDHGYTIVTKSIFKDMDDMKYYENQCEGHEEYKAFLKQNTKVEGLMMMYFTPSVEYETVINSTL